MQVVDPQSLCLETFCTLYGAAAGAAQRTQGLEEALSLPSSSLTLLPPSFEESLATASSEANIAWTTGTLLHLLPALAASEAHKPLLIRLCSQRLQHLLDTATTPPSSASTTTSTRAAGSTARYSLDYTLDTVSRGTAVVNTSTLTSRSSAPI